MERLPELSRWAQCHHNGPDKREEGGQNQRERTESEVGVKCFEVGRGA